MSTTERRILAGIILLGAALRLPGLGSVPPPLNPDEASRGYDAWSLLETGADRYGARWPLFARSFGPGDYTAAISVYLIIPAVAVLGPTAAAFRTPSALLGVLTIIGLWLWMRRALDARTALWAAFLLAVCPWHIRMSRVAHEAGLVPFFLTWGFAGIAMAGLPPFHASRHASRAKGQREPRRADIAWATVGGAMLGACAWDYPAARLLVPVLALAALAVSCRAYAERLRDAAGRRTIIAAVVGLVLGTAPVWWTWMRAPEQVAARARSTMVVFDQNRTLGQKLGTIAVNWAREFSPDVLFWNGDDINMPDTQARRTPDFGRLLLVAVPLIVIGMTVILGRCRTSSAHQFLLAWLLLHPLPAALCDGWNPHMLRDVLALPLWSIVSAIGASAIIGAVGRSSDTLVRPARFVIVAGILANSAWFQYAYIYRYPALVADDFQENLTRALAWAGRHEREFDAIWVTDFSNQPYIYALIYAPISPARLAELRAAGQVVTTPWYQDFEHVVRIGKYLFKPFPAHVPLAREADAVYRREFARIPAGARVLLIDVPPPLRPARGVLLASLPRRNGEPGLELRAWTAPPRRPAPAAREH